MGAMRDIEEAVDRVGCRRRPEDVRIPIVAWMDGLGRVDMERAGEDPFPDRSPQTVANLRAVSKRFSELANGPCTTYGGLAGGRTQVEHNREQMRAQAACEKMEAENREISRERLRTLRAKALLRLAETGQLIESIGVEAGIW